MEEWVKKKQMIFLTSTSSNNEFHQAATFSGAFSVLAASVFEASVFPSSFLSEPGAFSSPAFSTPLTFSFSCSLFSLFCLRLSCSLALLASFFFFLSSLCSSVRGFSFLRWFCRCLFENDEVKSDPFSPVFLEIRRESSSPSDKLETW